jgi:hypothetical protein
MTRRQVRAVITWQTTLTLGIAIRTEPAAALRAE